MSAALHSQLARLSARAAALSSGSVALGLDYLPHAREHFEHPARNKVIVCGRRWSKTGNAQVKALRAARSGKRVLWLSPTFRQAWRAVQTYTFRAVAPLPRGTWRWRQTDMQLRFAGGGYVDYASAERPETLLGAVYDLIILDEAATLLRDGNLYERVLLPMGIEGPGAEWVFISTPSGRGPLYALWLRAQGDPDWYAVRRPSTDNPIVNAKLLERLKRTMGDLAYREQILAEFVDDQTAVFKDAAIQAAICADAPSDPHSDKVYLIGADPAARHDYCALWVLDVEQRAGVYAERFNRVSWPEVASRTAALAQRYNRARIVADNTGVGGAFEDLLRDAGCHVTPVTFTSAVKAELVTRCVAALEAGDLRLFRHEDTIQELQAYERLVLPSGAVRYGCPAPLHDDLATALMLANWGLPAPHAEPGFTATVRSKAFLDNLDPFQRARYLHDHSPGEPA